MEWISTKEKLPEMNEKIIVRHSTGLIDTYTFYGICSAGWSMITHWMLLPKSPKESDEEYEKQKEI